jgi:hypothetical protein
VGGGGPCKVVGPAFGVPLACFGSVVLTLGLTPACEEEWAVVTLPLPSVVLVVDEDSMLKEDVDVGVDEAEPLEEAVVSDVEVEDNVTVGVTDPPGWEGDGLSAGAGPISPSGLVGGG